MSDKFLDCPERWPPDLREECAGTDTVKEYVFLARVAAQLSGNDLWTALRSGELAACVYRVGRTDFAPVPLSALEFLKAGNVAETNDEAEDEDAAQVLSVRDRVLTECQIDVRETDRRRPAAIRRVIPVPHWLYVTRTSLDKFMKARPAATSVAEKRTARHLAPKLKLDPNMTRAQAASFLDLDPRSRSFDRIWRESHEIAEVGTRPGPRRKSPQ